MSKEAFDKIAEGLRAAIAGDFARVTIDGQTWVKQEPKPHEWSNPYNDGYTHEALHTAYVLLDMWEEHVGGARCSQQFPDVAGVCSRASAAMMDCYQLIGTKFEDEA